MKTSDELIVQKLLERAAEVKASDLHLTVGSPPVMRIDDRLVSLHEFPVLTKDILDGAQDMFLDPSQREQFEKDREIVVAYALHKVARFRVSIFYQRGSIAYSFRYIGGRTPSLRDLGFTDAIQRLALLPRGLIVVCGPFGSGRTTVLTALVEEVNHRREAYVMTIEQPIEYPLINAQSVIEQREVGRDTPSIADGLHAVAQQDVDVVMISDMHEPSIVQTALTLAFSGRLVMGTLDTDSVMTTIDYILGTFTAGEQEHAHGVLAEALQAIICLRQVPRVGGGKILVSEILVATPPVRSVIREGNMSRLSTIMQTSREEGMTSLDSALASLVATGEVSLETALQYAQDPQALSMRAHS